MTIDEAIKIKEKGQRATLPVYDPRWKEADKLSIAALKRCKNFRDNSQTFGYLPLPGETEK